MSLSTVMQFADLYPFGFFTDTVRYEGRTYDAELEWNGATITVKINDPGDEDLQEEPFDKELTIDDSWSVEFSQDSIDMPFVLLVLTNGEEQIELETKISSE